jgi:catechol 2,3-dioxygenase-like lactoylglutathione lyase family enzyme
MLGDYDVIAFTQTAQPEKAKAFYRDILGLKLVEDSPFALVFWAGSTMLRIQKVPELTPLPFTVLGWNVPDIRATLANLSSKGVKFERYDGMPQDDAGIWVTPSGAGVCWFKDPDGNTLSLTQFPRSA